MYRIRLIPVNYENVKHTPPVHCPFCWFSAVGNQSKPGHGAHKKSCLNICLIFDFVPVRAVLRLSLGPRTRKVQLCATRDGVQPSEPAGKVKRQ